MTLFYFMVLFYFILSYFTVVAMTLFYFMVLFYFILFFTVGLFKQEATDGEFSGPNWVAIGNIILHI